MASRNLLLHPGSSQGGSTWIQNLCQKNAGRLEAQGLHYLHDYRALPFPKTADEDPAAFHAALRAFYDAQLPEGDGKTVFLSHENVFGDPLYEDGLFAQAPGLAEKLLPLFAPFDSARVVYVWRPLDRFLLSVYNQRKKQGSKITFQGFSDTAEARGYDSRHVVEALRILSRKAEIVIIDFEFLTRRQRRFAAEFLALGGARISGEFDFAQGARNPSISPEGIKILEFSKDLLDRPKYMDLRKFIQAKLPKTGMTAEEKAFLDTWGPRSAENDRVHRGALAEFARFIKTPAD